jgi:hypothetical protein
MLAGSAIFMNISSIHSPIPVFLSGVKLSAKLNPHGPAHTVSDAFVAATTPFACTSSGDHEGAPILSGLPEAVSTYQAPARHSDPGSLAYGSRYSISFYDWNCDDDAGDDFDVRDCRRTLMLLRHPNNQKFASESAHLNAFFRHS